MKKSMKLATLGLACTALTLSGCSTPLAKPAFYPNAHYQKVGAEQANADYEGCVQLAKDSDIGAVNKMDVLGIGSGAAVGGAVVGAVLGGNAGRLAGAAGGGSAVGTATKQAIGGSSLYRTFMHKCLSTKGYEIIGWK